MNYTWLRNVFTQADCYYVDYGQKGFKEHFYDYKSQAVLDKNNVKFEKGEYMKLLNYLEAQGWVKDSQRESELGDVNQDYTISKKRVIKTIPQNAPMLTAPNSPSIYQFF